MHLTQFNDKHYWIEFRHKTDKVRRMKGVVLPPELSPKGSVRAITTCVLVVQVITASEATTVLECDEMPGEVEFIAIDNAVCSRADPFSRPWGRQRAFEKLLSSCGALKDVRAQLAFAFADLKLGPKPQIPKEPKLQNPKPTPEQVATYRANAGGRDAVLRKRRERAEARRAEAIRRIFGDLSKAGRTAR